MDLALVQPRPTFVTVYQYDNQSIPGYYNQLWVAENTGLVMYVGQRGHTEWHGRFEELPFNMAAVTFHHHGQQNRLKHAVLTKRQNGYRGVDYRNRTITLTRLMRLQYDEDNRVWL